MSISIITALNTYNPIRNPIDFRVEGSAFDPGTPVRPSASIQFNTSDMPANGDTLTITAEILGDPIVFTFRTSPDPDELDLPIYGGSDLGGYLLNIAAQLIASYAINSHYYVVVLPTVGSNGIIALSARSLSDNFDIQIFDPSQDITFSVSGYTPDINTAVSSVPFELPANSALLLQLEVYSDYPNFSPTIILEEAYTPDVDGRAKFDMSDVLRSILKPYLPASNLVTNRSMYSAMTTFRVFIAERFGDPSETNKLTATPWVFAYLAGRSEEERIATPNWGTALHGGSSYRFLSAWRHTSYNQRKLVVPTQVEYLSWLYPASGPASIKVKADIYYETGSPALGQLLDTVNAKYNELLITPCGAGPLGLASIDSTRRIDHYRIYLTNASDTVISEYRWYQMDYLYHHNLVQMIWWSSTGNVDTITLTGRRSREGDVETITSGAYNQFPASIGAAANSVVRTDRLDTEVEQGTTYLREYEMHVLLDLMGSEAIHRLRSDGLWVPTAVLSQRSLPLAQDAEGVASREITYRDKLTNTAL